MDADLKAFLDKASALLDRLEPWLPKAHPQIDWATTLAARWQPEGEAGYLMPIAVRLDLNLTDLVGVDRQQRLLIQNTQQFVQGAPANHALLWGARGTGKSSLIRALLAHFSAQGLRLIEIDRDHLSALPRIVEHLGSCSERFIVFCDDLSFEAGEGDYRVLKSVLDGSLERAPENILLYATSNRRHLVPERQADNENWQLVEGEVHPSEAVEDKIALSDRFGLSLSFYPFTQGEYLDAVKHWAGLLSKQHGLPDPIWTEVLEKEAIRWATARGNRSGRCAYQYARSWVGSCLMEQAEVK